VEQVKQRNARAPFGAFERVFLGGVARIGKPPAEADIKHSHEERERRRRVVAHVGAGGGAGNGHGGADVHASYFFLLFWFGAAGIGEGVGGAIALRQVRVQMHFREIETTIARSEYEGFRFAFLPGEAFAVSDVESGAENRVGAIVFFFRCRDRRRGGKNF